MISEPTLSTRLTGPDLFTRSACQIALHRFMRDGWHAVEGSGFRPGWHIGAMAEHLEAVSFGQIQRLIIIVPPQSSKSILAGTFWPAWEWTFRPHIRWLYSSNSDDLALEESMRCRRLIESDWYRHEFGIPWELRDDQNAKGYYQNTYGGDRRALGFGANFTGKKGNRLVIDDANDAEKVHSEAERKRVNRKFDNSISDRHIDLNNDPTVVIGQRTHWNDLIGHLLALGGWQVLHLREEFLPKHRQKWPVPVPLKTPSGVQVFTSDPRTREGELLRPKDFNQTKVRERRRTNLMGYQAKHQGDPRSAEGLRFKLDWFRDRWRFAKDGVHIELQRAGEDSIYLVHPYGVLNFKELFGIVDPSASKKVTADFMVTSSFIITQRFDLIWYGCKRQRAEIPDQPAILEAEYKRLRLAWVGVEAIFGNRGLFQHAMRTQMNVRPLSTQKDKLAHATAAMILCESRRVWLPNQEAANLSGFPLLEVIDELTSFTGDDQQDEHDDVIDTISYAAEHFNTQDTGGATGAIPMGIGPPSATAWQGRPPGAPPSEPPPGPFPGGKPAGGSPFTFGAMPGGRRPF